jgi:hypothetical protein
MQKEGIFKGDLEGGSDAYYEIYREVSDADYSAVQDAKDFFKELPELPTDIFEAAKEIRHFLIKKGFSYNDRFFSLQDVIKEKRGNCLGLTLLYGAILKERGFDPSFRIVTHALDGTDKYATSRFVKAKRGDYFEDYENPPLETEEHPELIFAPLEHPALVLDGKVFETTSLEDVEEDPNYSPDAELIRPVNFTEAASNVYLEKAQWFVKNKEKKFSKKNLLALKELVLKAIRLWPENREAWEFLWSNAKDLGEEKLADEAKQKYLSFAGEDSRFYFFAYLMTGDIKYLDQSLAKYEAFLEPFITKNVMMEKDEKEARFNLAVASWAAARSSAYGLKWFYKQYADQVRRLYGEDKLKEILSRLQPGSPT